MQRSAHLPFLATEGVLAGLVLGLSTYFKNHPGPLTADAGLEVGVQKLLLPHALPREPIEAISTLDFTVPVIVTLAVLCTLFLLLRRWLDAIVVPVAAGVQGLGNTAIKDWVRRPRPAGHGIHVVTHITSSFSFPSGHVTYATAVYGLFFFLSTQVRRPLHPALIWGVRVVALALILLMPVSRVLEGAHWPSDTLGGALEGLFWLVLFAHVYLWARRRWPPSLAADER